MRHPPQRIRISLTAGVICVAPNTGFRQCCAWAILLYHGLAVSEAVAMKKAFFGKASLAKRPRAAKTRVCPAPYPPY
jgi:hypothetical protein